MVKPSVKPQKLQKVPEVEQENDLNSSNVSKGSQNSKSGDKVKNAAQVVPKDVGSGAKTVEQNGGVTEDSQDFMAPSQPLCKPRTLSQKANLILPVLKVCNRLAAWKHFLTIFNSRFTATCASFDSASRRRSTKRLRFIALLPSNTSYPKSWRWAEIAASRTSASESFRATSCLLCARTPNCSR